MRPTSSRSPRLLLERLGRINFGLIYEIQKKTFIFGENMAFEIEKLAFDTDSLEPDISKKALETHYLKHYKKYVSTLNELVKGTEFEKLDLKEVLIRTFQKNEAIFHNAAQAFNHAFFWKCLSPDKTQASRELRAAIVEKFGSLDDFKAKFSKSAVELFGSGWVWLVQNSDGELAIEALANADNPLVYEMSPIMVCDLWEHAYYLDYQNDKPKYLDKFWRVLNWDFVSANYKYEAPYFEKRQRDLGFEAFLN